MCPGMACIELFLFEVVGIISATGLDDEWCLVTRPVLVKSTKSDCYQNIVRIYKILYQPLVSLFSEFLNLLFAPLSSSAGGSRANTERAPIYIRASK
jgi:hypothetical protein